MLVQKTDDRGILFRSTVSHALYQEIELFLVYPLRLFTFLLAYVLGSLFSYGHCLLCNHQQSLQNLSGRVRYGSF